MSCDAIGWESWFCGNNGWRFLHIYEVLFSDNTNNHNGMN